jgi:hypothetical protein
MPGVSQQQANLPALAYAVTYSLSENLCGS